ncbi:alpha/beta hydrolase [Aureibaculum sp. 2210JD6-5]|uniref:alpha/beta hydrolase n=1 Tax=Aureibaculum sp. 2210JD6-5 TaxID=3103957 RepID=UPI002AAED47C|nr:alpha/beta hydrolase [Aureibaculum sp. 2210JD6-5]MDY7394267.1 alpha/beta hydrolase [Aureibaculum sp. 2210JD6-5]
MKSKISQLLFSLSTIILLFISCTDDSSSPETILEKSQSKDVSYGDHPQQKYDIYLPKGRTSKSTKVFILVHGGGWIEGDKNDMNAFIPELQKESPNHAIVNINYRLASEGNSPFPMQIDDIKAIIADLKSKKEDYQISNQYAFIGSSAGAHLSMLYSYAYDINNEVDMVCSIVGPTNFTDDAYVNATEITYALLALQIQNITGVLFQQNMQFYRDNSPYHVATTSAPPTILFYGDEDPLIPSSQGRDMHEKLDELGVTNEFTIYTGEGHGWTGENLLDTTVKLRAFIKVHF